MNPIEAAELMAQLGITGVDPTKMAAAMTLVQQLGGQVSVDQEAVESYYPEVDEESFYVPKAPKGFYLGDTKTLRKLNTPNAGVFRRLLGIK